LYGIKTFTLINNAISVQRYLADKQDTNKIKTQFSLPKNKQLVLHVGRFSIVKNHQFLLELAKDKTLNPGIHFVCVGEGPLKADFAEAIQQEAVQSRFTLLPATPDIPLLLKSADAFIMPSLFEGISVALLEAQAAALPCLISNTIAKASDMGLALVTFNPLEDLSPWLMQLNNLPLVDLTADKVTEAFLDKGFSTESVLAQLTNIYSSRDMYARN
jgi:glycosyltransferase EpsF